MTDEMVMSRPGSDGGPEAAGAGEAPVTEETMSDTGIDAIRAPRGDAGELDLPALRDQILGVLDEYRRQDRFREDQVERLHRELQDHRAGLLEKTTRPLVLSLIRLHDDLGRCGEAWREKPPEELTLERLLEILEGFQEDVEIELSGFGIEAYRHPDDRFDPQRQQSLRTVEAPRLDLAGRLAKRLRPGYTHGSDVIRKEKVVVYRSPSPSPAAPTPEDDSAGEGRHEAMATPEEAT